MSYEFTTSAIGDFAEAARHYQRLGAGLGTRFVAEIYAAIEHAESFPQLGRQYPGGLRKRRIRDFPYELIFRFREGHLIVAAVHHRRRHPDRWLRRDH